MASSKPVQQTVYQTNIPEFMQPYASRMLGKAEALTDLSQNPYQPYEGQQVAGFNPLQTQAFQSLAEGAQDFTGGNVEKYMSPYMQEVVKQQQLGAIEDYSKSLPQLASATTQVGGLGGTRQALLQAEGQRGLQGLLSNIRAQGLQSAYSNAQQQFNQQLQNRLAAAQAQLGAGQQIQGTEQRGLDALLAAFNAQQQYPYQQLGFMSNLLRGLPTMQQSAAMYQQPGSSLGQIANLGMGIGSLMGGG